MTEKLSNTGSGEHLVFFEYIALRAVGYGSMLTYFLYLLQFRK
jgi:hypothetical protein